MEIKFKVGQIVTAKESPGLLLTVRRYYNRIYYCTIQGHPAQKDLVYFERELIQHPTS